MSDDNKFEVPTSTKWDVGMTAITLVFVVGSILTLIFTQMPFDFEAASPFMKAVMIGAIAGTVFAVGSLVFNVLALIFIGIGAVFMVIYMQSREAFKKWRQKTN